MTNAVVLQPLSLETVTRDLARVLASLKSCMNAPFPHFTSITSPSKPAANFFERIEAVIKSIDSTVPVTSLMA